MHNDVHNYVPDSKNNKVAPEVSLEANPATSPKASPETAHATTPKTVPTVTNKAADKAANKVANVAVLMSTYNGEKYIKEQIDSILAQDDVNVTLFVRDDGSSDKTVEILKSYCSSENRRENFRKKNFQVTNSETETVESAQSRINTESTEDTDGTECTQVEVKRNIEERVNVQIGKNIGVGNSFMQLVYSVGYGNIAGDSRNSNGEDNYFDYYAFDDQDDVWFPRKLKSGIKAINDKINDKVTNDKNTPMLYCSNQLLVDKDLKYLGLRFEQKPDISYKQILCSNTVTGCTMLWNRELQKILCKNRPSAGLLRNRIHDVWVAMVAAVVGEIIYDDDAYIYYRQHENNVVGVRHTGILSEWINKILRPELRNGRSLLAREIVAKLGSEICGRSVLKELKLYANYKDNLRNKYKLICDPTLRKYSGESQLLYAVKILMNLL